MTLLKNIMGKKKRNKLYHNAIEVPNTKEEKMNSESYQYSRSQKIYPLFGGARKKNCL